MIEELNGLDELPHGWIRTQLGEIAEIILGQSPPSSTYNEEGRGLPFYQGKLEFGKSYPTPRKWCMAPKKIAEKGDVLISVRAPVGPTNVCREKSCIGRGLAAIRGLGGIGTFFILYVLRAFENEIVRKGTGTTFSAIGGDKLKALEIPLPPLNEQERIVAKLEELFTRLDAGVEGLLKVKAQLKRYRQAVLKHAFEGKLTEEWRKTHKDQLEPATKLLEQIKQERKRTEERNNSLSFVEVSYLPVLPENWLWTELGEIADVVLGQSPPSSTYNETAEGLPFYQGKLEFGKMYPTPRKWCTEPQKIAEKGDVLISVRAPVGPTNICPEKSCIGRGLAAIRGYDGILQFFIFYVLRASEGTIAGKGTGTTFKAITGGQLRNIKIPLAPIAEQRKIVEIIEQLFFIADEIEKNVEQGIRQAERLRQSLLKVAFEGRLVPQHPSDEPAEKLLQRIKEERAKPEGEKNINQKKTKPKQLELSTYVE